MRAWNLGINDPLMLTLCADARLSPVDYPNDQIWELSLSGGEPAALTVFTTFGMRARAMRLFPRFRHGSEVRSDPAEFYRPPRITRLFASHLEVRFSPFTGLDVIAEYRALSSQSSAGRFTFHNPSVLTEKFTFEWCAYLNPLGNGNGMRTVQVGVHPVLQGKTEELSPVCFITGGLQPGKGPYASLTEEAQLSPGGVRQLTWALAALPSPADSYELARQSTARAWEAEQARIELTHRSERLEITTNNPDWDAAFALAARCAESLFFPASQSLPRQSFVLSRKTDHGFSLRGDGSDYNALWNGQTALDCWHMSSLILPGMPDRLAGLVENFLATSMPDGFIDWKPGLAGQRSRRMAQPLLAALTLKVHQTRQDPAWLEKVYPPLLSFLRCWFSLRNDRDQDGFPEWEHPFQSGLEESPLFNPWHPAAQGVEPKTIETPALAAMLYNEAGCLLKIASLIGETANLDWLEQQRSRLRANVEAAWDESDTTYTHRDALTHAASPADVVFTFDTRGQFPIERQFDPPSRLVLHFNTQTDLTRRIHLILSGSAADGSPILEEINPQDVSWLHGIGRYTSRSHFKQLDSLKVLNLHPGDSGALRTINFREEDLSLLLPLWAGIPDPSRADRLVNQTILTRYRQPYGLTVVPASAPGSEITETQQVLLPWNWMIAEGLLNYGYRKEALSLFEDWMKAIVHSLKNKRAFYAAYHPVSGQGSGESNLLTGLPPIEFFLRLLGIRLLTDTRIILDALTPFSFPVTVQYRRMT
ncbi:MAG: trehalase family glycosidase, partial [Chloroflexota bacterium]